MSKVKSWRLNTTKNDHHSIENSLKLMMFGALLLTAGLHSTEAQADCTSPTATAGTWEYFTSAKQFRYCDGTDWISRTTGLKQDFGDGTSARLYIFASSTCPTGAQQVGVTGPSDEVSLCFEYNE